MDVSQSMSDKNWKDEKKFVMRLIKEFDILPLGAHASVITFDGTALLEIKFSDYFTNEGFEGRLNKAKHI